MFKRLKVCQCPPLLQVSGNIDESVVKHPQSNPSHIIYNFKLH